MTSIAKNQPRIVTPGVIAGEPDDRTTLAETLDRLLDHGVALKGELRIGVAGVDLLFAGVEVFLASADKADALRASAVEAQLPPHLMGGIE